MNTLRTVLIVCALLSPWMARAAAPQHGACMLALKAQPAVHPAGHAAPAAEAVKPPAAKQRKKINIDFLYDPCSMTDAERDNEQAEKPMLSRDQLLQEYENWMEWNRRQPGGTPDGMWWFSTVQAPHAYAATGTMQALDWMSGQPVVLSMVTRQGGQPWLEQVETLPAVPEPQAYALWLAGLGCVALAARRRRLSGGKARPAARR
ncbi:PEP-CTERM sorting domain-containing protein [Rugamonas rivuli]|uniref:PEP-CTERM sorting domain-containing protein n=1 Tax=Rugamonas rivuli TaxID=2743358 RepID=A0A843SCS5_9BURK|nr:PEP-CTERM sorting domain-containing protein [Rugamonas rivuli]MQA19983.1 PEP-CTERM sorting domain-containing protein [Rugamonas rivuli]